MPTNKFKATIRFEEKLYDKLREIADRENRSINNLVEHWVALAVEDYEKKNADGK